MDPKSRDEYRRYISLRSAAPRILGRASTPKDATESRTVTNSWSAKKHTADPWCVRSGGEASKVMWVGPRPEPGSIVLGHVVGMNRQPVKFSCSAVYVDWDAA